MLNVMYQRFGHELLCHTRCRLPFCYLSGTENLDKQDSPKLLLQGNHSRRALEEELSRSVSKGTGGNWGLVQGAVGGLSSQDAATSYVPQNVTPVIERMLQVVVCLALL